MPLNKARGNMFSFVTHTFNMVKGRCPHDCNYCFMKRFGEQKPVRYDAGELNTNLGNGNFIFVGSSCDMFADDIPEQWIKDTLYHLNQFDNQYLFQTKNPARIAQFMINLPFKSMIGCTIETNRFYPDHMGKTPHPKDRAKAMRFLTDYYSTMINVEPVMVFNMTPFRDLIISCKPDWVTFGADSKGHKLPEPHGETLKRFIGWIRDYIPTVIEKDNLKRLTGAMVVSYGNETQGN